MPIPTTDDLTIVQGATFLEGYTWVEPGQQRLYKVGSGAGTFTLTLFSQTTAALTSATAAASDVQAALRALARVGAAGVVVTGSGTSGSPWGLAWGGQLAGEDVPLLTVTPSNTNWAFNVADVPKDLTGWTAALVAKEVDTSGAFGPTILSLTHTATADGQIILGYVPASTEGGAPGTADPTNGQIGILVNPSKTATMATGGRYALDLTKTSTSYVATVLDGKISIQKEPA